MIKGYISVKDAAAAWGLTARRVQYYCANGYIDGVIRFGRSWAIPENTEKYRVVFEKYKAICNALAPIYHQYDE